MSVMKRQFELLLWVLFCLDVWIDQFVGDIDQKVDEDNEECKYCNGVLEYWVILVGDGVKSECVYVGLVEYLFYDYDVVDEFVELQVDIGDQWNG